MQPKAGRTTRHYKLFPATGSTLTYSDESSLDNLIKMAIHLDNLLLDCRCHLPATRRPRSPPPEPMQLRNARLTPVERPRRRNEGLCYYCGQGQNRAEACPVKSSPGAAASTHSDYPYHKPIQVSPVPFILKSSFHIKAVIMHSGKSHNLYALIDSGSSGNIMNMATATCLRFPITRLP